MPSDAGDSVVEHVARADAFELFGDMRHSTPEEQDSACRCTEKHAASISATSIFNMKQTGDASYTELNFNIFDSEALQNERSSI